MFSARHCIRAIGSGSIRWFVASFQKTLERKSSLSDNTNYQKDFRLLCRARSVTLSSCNSWVCGNVACPRAMRVSDIENFILTRVKFSSSNASNLGIYLTSSITSFYSYMTKRGLEIYFSCVEKSTVGN